MGTLCRLWDLVEKATNSNEQSVNTLPDDMQKFMVGQSSNTVTYHRRYNLLNNLIGSSNQVKEALKEKRDLLQKHDGNLQGKKFRNHIVEVTKTKRQQSKPFQLENQNLEAAERRHFQKPHSVNIRKGGEFRGVRFSSPEAPTIKTTNKDSINKTPIRIEEEDTNTQAKKEEDMVRLNKNPHFRTASDVALVLEDNFKLVHSIVQRLFYRKVLPNLLMAGRLNIFTKTGNL